MSLSQSRNSHERNLERSLEDQAERTRSRSRTPGDQADAVGNAASGVPDAPSEPETDVASRLAREAAEREAVRRASGRE